MKRKLLTVCMAALSLCAEPLSEKGYIRNWLVSGPYPSYQTDGKGAGLETDFLKGESAVKPYPGQKASSVFVADKSRLIALVGSTNEWGYRETKTFDTTWKVWNFTEDTANFKENAFPVKDYFGAYAVCYLESPKAQKAIFYAGSDDDHKLYLNGKLVGRVASSQGANPQFKYNVRLQPGINTIVFKVIDRTGGYGFALGVLDEKMKPLPGLQVYTDHPGRKHGVELYSNGCGANLLFDQQDLMEGTHNLKLKLHNPKNYTVLLDGKKVSSQQVSVNMKQGVRTFTLAFYDGQKKVAEVTKSFVVYSEKKLREENAKLVAEIAEMKRMLPKLKQESVKLDRQLKDAEEYLKKAYVFRENAYAAERAKNIKGAPRSISEKLAPATLRSSLCLNGIWEISVNKKNWKPALLPNWMMHNYFVTWYYPARPVKPKDAHGPRIAADAFKPYFSVDDNVTAQHAFFRTTFESDGKNQTIFTSTAVQGRLNVYCNGTLCGTYEGKCGILDFPLKNVKAGKNELMLELWRPRGHVETWGLRGDLYIRTVPQVSVQDIYIKPSWRKGTLETRTELLNGTKAAVNAEICQYAVSGNAIKHRLPVQKMRLEPGKTVMVKNVSRWADPKIWGHGGKYGNPDLYDLVTDIKINGKIADRHVQRFGFREFWIFHTDFYLNGKRVILQGNVGMEGAYSHFREIAWDLLRRDHINIFRLHDSGAQWCSEIAADADRTGMLIYAQWYPNVVDNPKNPTPYEKWTGTALHKENLAGYDRWFRMFRNHPSVVIWSSDNEIVTQATDSAEKADINIRREKIASLYEKYMKKLDPDLVLTRDGDIATWNHKQRWYEDPPCDTANYHYPDFNVSDWVVNWQAVYEYRPVIFGETLYHSYGAWNHWIGAIPKQMLGKAVTVRRVASIYRELGIPGPIYMGLSSDGFIIWDNSGKGNPWGITADQHKAFSKTGKLPPNMKADQYPCYRISWPALSGKGFKIIAKKINITTNGESVINWVDPRYGTHIRNAVNDAYRDSLIPQQPLRSGTDAECVIVTAPDMVVWTTLPNGERYGVRADKNGKAWFQFADPGTYTFTANGKSLTKTLSNRSSYALKPGFENVKSFNLK